MPQQQRNQKGQYKCEQCTQSFKSQNELKQHNSEQHGSGQQRTSQSSRSGSKTRTAGGR